MVDIKEIKSVRIVPFTLMSSALSAVLGLIYAIILIFIIGIVGAFIPGISTALGLIATFSVAMIIIFPVGAFLFSILSSFLMALIYNLLVPRIGGIKLGMDGKEVKTLPVIPVSLMLAAIYTKLTFIMMLIVAPLLAVGLQGAALAATNTTASVPELSGLGALGTIGALILLIGIPILVFIAIFISMALTALFYNICAPKIGGVQLKLKNAAHNFCEIKKIPAVPLALISAVVLTIVNFIFSLPSLAIYIGSGQGLFGLGYLVGNILGSFISTFILYAIMAIIYNFFRPKIGGVEIELD